MDDEYDNERIFKLLFEDIDEIPDDDLIAVDEFFGVLGEDLHAY